MSRIYSNDPLTSLPVVTVNWGGPWPPRSTSSSSKGVLLEGTISSRSRFVITTSSDKIRYFVLFINVRRAHRRVFDSKGKEEEPNFSETQKIRTGYLHSSYKTAAKGKSDILSFDELLSEVQCDQLTVQTDKHTATGCVALWILEKDLEGIELSNGDEIRMKTTGSGPFIESIAKLDVQSSATCNYAGGEKVGGSWTDKVFAVKESQEDKTCETRNKDNEGAGDDEWED